MGLYFSAGRAGLPLKPVVCVCVCMYVFGSVCDVSEEVGELGERMVDKIESLREPDDRQREIHNIRDKYLQETGCYIWPIWVLFGGGVSAKGGGGGGGV